jgi:hypothetical protein
MFSFKNFVAGNLDEAHPRIFANIHEQQHLSNSALLSSVTKRAQETCRHREPPKYA